MRCLRALDSLVKCINWVVGYACKLSGPEEITCNILPHLTMAQTGHVIYLLINLRMFSLKWCNHLGWCSDIDEKLDPIHGQLI